MSTVQIVTLHWNVMLTFRVLFLNIVIVPIITTTTTALVSTAIKKCADQWQWISERRVLGSAMTGTYDVARRWGYGRADEPIGSCDRGCIGESTHLLLMDMKSPPCLFILSLISLALPPHPLHQAFCCSDAALNAAPPCSPQLLFSG